LPAIHLPPRFPLCNFRSAFHPSIQRIQRSGSLLRGGLEKFNVYLDINII
jgi:hypothetical protein